MSWVLIPSGLAFVRGKILEQKVVMRDFFTFLEQYRFVREGSWLLLILSTHHIKHPLVCEIMSSWTRQTDLIIKLYQVFLAAHISLLLQTSNAQMVM